MAVDQTKVNEISLISTAPVDSTENWQIEDPIIRKGGFAYDKDTKTLKVGLGKKYSETPNHQHNDQYSGIGHGHYFGYGEKWFRSTPRLWLISDLINHPELIPLNGQQITDEVQAASLCDIYSGRFQISPTITTGASALADVSASSTLDGLHQAWKVCGEPLTNANFFQTTDQWLAAADDPVASLKISFLGEYRYKLYSYMLCPRIGTDDAPFKKGPTPRSWEIRAYTDATTYTVVHTVTDADPWTIGGAREYTLDLPTGEIVGVEFHPTAWYPGADESMTPGLKRFRLEGIQSNYFHMPSVPSPHEDFVYVVPYKDLGIGMKHEEVGDLIYTISPTPLAAPNRILLDGRAVRRSIEPDLFAMIGYKYDPIHNLAGITVETEEPHAIQITDGAIVWSSTMGDDQAIAEFFDIKGLTEKLSAYYLAPTANGPKPIQWNVEGWNGTTWSVLHTKTFDPNTEQYGWFDIAEDHDTESISIYRLSVETWSGTGTIGLAPMQIRTHPADFYYIPDLVENPSDVQQPYIISRVRVEDVNDDIVARLQTDLARALNILIANQQRLAVLESALAAKG